MTGWAWVGGVILLAADVAILLGWVLGDSRPAFRLSIAGCGGVSVGAIWMAAALALA